MGWTHERNGDGIGERPLAHQAEEVPCLRE
jgi:hypothetical protein